jgi:hypothetical protein
MPSIIDSYEGKLSRDRDIATATDAGEAARLSTRAVCEAIWGLMLDGHDRNDSEITAALWDARILNPVTKERWKLDRGSHGRKQIQQAGFIVAVTRRPTLRRVPESGGRDGTTWRLTTRMSFEEFQRTLRKHTNPATVTRAMAQAWKDALNESLPRTLSVDPKITELLDWLTLKAKKKDRKSVASGPNPASGPGPEAP